MFLTPVDIVNRGLQHLGVPRITALTDSSKQAVEANFVYDKLRRAELQRAVWNCSVKRAVLRKIVVGTSKRILPATYSSATSYGFGDIIKDANSVYYISNQAANSNNTPGAGGINPPWSAYYGPVVAQLHDVAVAYIPGDIVYLSSTAYICSTAHTNQTPPNTTYWQPLTATLSGAITFLSPIGYKPDASAVRQIYQLPVNFLRMAPLDPKVAGNARQNVAAGMAYNDYEFESGFLASAAQGSTFADPLVLRFVADQTDVPTMDDLLCEAIAARIGVELAETLTQSQQKLAFVTSLYDNTVAVAKMVNAIEAGTTENEPNTPIAQAAGGQQQGGG